MRKSFKKGGGVNTFHGQLSSLLPHIQPLLENYNQMGQPGFVKVLNTPTYKYKQRGAEDAIFDGLCMIDILLEMIKITMVTKLEGTIYNNMDAKMEINNIESIISDLRNNWLNQRIKIDPSAKDYVKNIHAAELWTAMFHLIYKPTEFVEGLNVIFDEFFKQK